MDTSESVVHAADVALHFAFASDLASVGRGSSRNTSGSGLASRSPRVPSRRSANSEPT